MTCVHAFDPAWKAFNGGRCGRCAWLEFRLAARPVPAPARHDGSPRWLASWMMDPATASTTLRAHDALFPYVVHRAHGAVLLTNGIGALGVIGFVLARKPLREGFQVCVESP